jgi:hypothetical protein
MKRCLIFGLFFCVFTASAQLKWWGIFDFEIRKGGKDSDLEKNGLENGNIQLNLQQLHLFLDADLGSNITFTAKLANNPVKGFEVRDIELQMAYVTFSNLIGDALSISAGRILTPFGTFAKRQLPSENPFIGQPLFFSYTQNVSSLTGYLPQKTYPDSTEYGSRLTTMYCGGYYTGIDAAGSFFNNALEYDFACMNAPLSAKNGDYNVDKGLAFHGRVAFHPAIWSTIGVSYAVGSFMESSYKSFEQEYTAANNFNQSTYGVDLLLSYLYFEVNAEYIMNRFDAPYIIYIASDSTYDNGYASGSGLTRPLESQEYLIDAKLEAPFYPGLYLAVRYDALTFNDILDTHGSLSAWDRNVVRSAVGLGYKPDRNVLIKLGYERTSIDTRPTPDLDIWECAIVVTLQ